MEEEWRDIPRYERIYQISNLGRIKSLSRKHCPIEKSLNAHTDKDGYKYVILYKNKQRKFLQIHRLVLLAFVGPCPKGQEACHNNDIKYDNQLSNLRWDTHSNNIKDSVNNGTRAGTQGEKNGYSKLTEKQILEIRRLYEARLPSGKRKYTQQQLAEKFNTTRQNISKIINMKRWKHI